MSLASNQVVWNCVRAHNRFLVKRDGVQFSKEPANPTGINSFKNSGLANDRAVGVRANNKRTGVELVIKKRNSRRIRRNGYTVSLNRIHNPRAINKVVDAENPRADLNGAALAKSSALSKTLRKKSLIPADAKTKKDVNAAFFKFHNRALTRAQRNRQARK